jgi:hypothetical protein
MNCSWRVEKIEGEEVSDSRRAFSCWQDYVQGIFNFSAVVIFKRLK